MSLPRYPNYKDSGVEWLGEVPEHWDASPLKAVATHNDDVLDETTAPDSEIVYVDISSVDPIDGITAKEAMIFSAAPSRARRRVQHGDVIVSTVRTYLRAIARVRDPEENLVVSTGFAVVRPGRKLAPDFLGYIVSASYFVEQVIARSTGVSYPAINASELVAIPVAVPPLSEQIQIAAFLDRETAKIDELVAEQRRLMELLKEKRQAVISHAVTRGLNPDAPLKPSGIEWLGDVPEHWEVTRLKHISPAITVGIVVNPSSFVTDEGLPFIYGGDIREGVIDWVNARCIDTESSDKHVKTQLHAGDLLTVRVGAPGITAVVPNECEGGNCASVMHIRQGPFNSNWLCYTMNTRVVRFQVEVVQYGAAQEQFNISHAVNFWMPTPPRSEQDEIAAFLDSETAKLDTLTTEAQRTIDLLQERRTALISAAVTGQIDVRVHVSAEVAL
ncbi:restriction endonuclease subunit S [Rhodoferax sp.]|uniref:restriction endonuclease subunit S n=1 Tax=Rhodoferax sp. TaxID=50421 RepID=UPI0025CF6E26|nr:restriction endonuclease subunit S [Rhodoferax sp.]MCM2297122.1 restriction endonuclease subunit S [Rhodoferax sp.]